MELDEIRDARAKSQAVLEAALETLVKAKRGEKPIERASFFASMNFRFLGLAAYLIDGDVNGFHNGLFRAARCRLHYYVHLMMGLGYEGSIGAMTNDSEFFDALACQSERTALLLSWYHVATPRAEFDEPERVRYSYYVRSLVHPVIVERKPYKDAGIEDWLREPGKSAEQMAAQGIHGRDSELFTRGITGLLDQRRRLIEAGGAEKSQKWCHIEALGLLWQARRRGLEVKIDDGLIPWELQSPRRARWDPNGLPQLGEADIEVVDAFLSRKTRKSLEEVKKWRPDPREVE